MKKTPSPVAQLIRLCGERQKTREDLFFYTQTRNDAKTKELREKLRSIDSKIRALETGR